MHIYVSLALWGVSSERLESSFYAYLHESRPLVGVLGKALKAVFMYICVSLALW